MKPYFDNTKKVKEIGNLIAKQVVSSIQYIGEHKDVTINVSKHGYSLKQVISFIYNVKAHFDGDDYVQTEYIKVTELKERTETYEGKQVNTTLYNGNDIAKYVGNILNK